MDDKLKVLFYLKKNETRADGTCPVMGRITVGRTMEQFSAKARVPLSLWDTKAGRAKGKTKAAAQTNASLNRISVAISENYREIIRRKGSATATEVKEAFQGITCSQETLVRYFEAYNERYRQRVGVDRAYGSWKHFRCALRHVEAFLKKRYNLTDIPLAAIERSLIDDFDFHLRIELKLKPGSIKEITRHLRLIVKTAVSERIITRDPLDGYRPPHVEQHSRHLSEEHLDRLIATPIENPTLARSRDMFLMTCFTGLAWTDLFHLTPDKIVQAADGTTWIRTRRRKTGELCNIPLLDLPQAIIERHRNPAPEGRLLPVPDNCTLNKHLKKIAGICGVPLPLTCHMGRHTYASQVTLAQGVSIESVSSMLGHRSMESTQRYAKVTPAKIGEDMTALEEKIADKYKLAL